MNKNQTRILRDLVLQLWNGIEICARHTGQRLSPNMDTQIKIK